MRRHALASFALLALSACQAEKAPVRIGIAVEPGWYTAVRMAQARLSDLPIEWIGDSTRNVQAASSAIDYADWLTGQGVSAVVGHSGSRGSVAAGTVYARHQVVQVAPIATTHQITARGRRAFGLVPNDSTEGAYIAAFVDTALHARRAALLYHQDEFGLGIRDGVSAELTRRGLSVVDERFFSPEGADGLRVNVEILLRAALRSGPDVIILGARIGETREVASYLRKQRISIPVVCSDGSYVLPTDQKSSALADLEGFYIVRFWSPDRDSAATAFASEFQARFGYLPDQSEALTYDAVMLVGAAVRDGARSADDFTRVLSSYGAGRARRRGVTVDGYAFHDGRPITSAMEMGVVRNGILRRADGAAVR